MIKQEVIGMLYDARTEIRRLNKGAGRTIFNPAITSMIDQYLNDEGVTVVYPPHLQYDDPMLNHVRSRS